jgi:hypothetical protein
LPCYVPSLLEMLQPSIWAFKFNAHLQCDFINLLFCSSTIHCSTEHCKTLKTVHVHFTLFNTTHPYLFWNITPLHRLLFNWIPISQMRQQGDQWHSIQSRYFTWASYIFIDYPNHFTSISAILFFHSCFTLVAGLKNK